MKDRPNAQQYKNEMQDLLNKTEKLRQVIVTRLYSLCVGYPEVSVISIKDEQGVSLTDIKAKSLIPTNRSKGYIKSLPIETQINFIAIIEKWLAEQNPVKQMSINF